MDPTRINWLFAGVGVQQEPDPFDEAVAVEDETVIGDRTTIFPGTYVFSKAVEEPFGVGRMTEVTIVRLPRPVRTAQERARQEQPKDRLKLIEHTLQMVYWDILDGSRNGDGSASYTSVINLSRSIDSLKLPSIWDGVDNFGDRPQDDDNPHFHFYNWLKELADLGVVIVVPAGGDADPTVGETQTMRSIPSVWASSRAADQWQASDLPLIVSKSLIKCSYNLYGHLDMTDASTN
jgi:hypothetical protein